MSKKLTHLTVNTGNAVRYPLSRNEPAFQESKRLTYCVAEDKISPLPNEIFTGDFFVHVHKWKQRWSLDILGRDDGAIANKIADMNISRATDPMLFQWMVDGYFPIVCNSLILEGSDVDVFATCKLFNPSITEPRKPYLLTQLPLLSSGCISFSDISNLCIAERCIAFEILKTLGMVE